MQTLIGIFTKRSYKLELAVIVVLPSDKAVTVPLSTVATFVLEDSQLISDSSMGPDVFNYNVNDLEEPGVITTFDVDSLME